MYKILLTLGLIFLAYFGAWLKLFKVWQSMNQKQVPQILKNRMQGNKEMTDMQKMIEERMKSV
jgi:hypothetical protein